MFSSAPPTQAAPLEDRVIERAGQWWARTMADDASPADTEACAAWRAEHPDHERAWQALQVLDSRFMRLPEIVPAGIAQQVLSEAQRTSLPHSNPKRLEARTRRQLLGFVILAPSVMGIAYVGQRSQTWQTAWADLRTSTGEIRTEVLSDGTQLVLDSASAVDVAYSGTERRIVLRTGQVMVTSAPDAQLPARPLLVQTLHGSATAMGTRFSVALRKDNTCLEVFEGAVLVKPSEAPFTTMQIDAGQGARFGTKQIGSPRPVETSAQSWTQGQLSVSDMRLADVVRRLARYRNGILRCDPAIADLRVTGVFPLRDSERALHNLTLGLPVRLQYLTRYWVTLVPR
ncbi:FecR domain-containing protein [Lampropedia puyangensis]|nr:FecR domain-containing protein [Lampropedia puyangensis]